MKYKKYILCLLLVMVLGCNRTYADEINGIKMCENETDCFYTSSQSETWLCYNPQKKKVTITMTEEANGNSDPLINFSKDKTDSETGIVAPKVGNSCPQYLVYRYKDGWLFFNSEGIWGFNDSTTAKDFVSKSNDIKNMNAYLATRTTKDNYEKKLIETFKGKPGSTTINGEDADVTCGDLFGDKNDPESIRYLVDEILQYVRIIVPILVIVFGIIDFAKAVIASKEDEMKKAQSTFIKRLIIGVAFFFIPIFVDIIMDLADIVWEGLGYTTCDI